MRLTDLKLVNLKYSYQAIQVFINIMASSAVKCVKKLHFLSSRLLSSPWALHLSFVMLVADLQDLSGYGGWRPGTSNKRRNNVGLVVGKSLDKGQLLSGWGLD